MFGARFGAVNDCCGARFRDAPMENQEYDNEARYANLDEIRGACGWENGLVSGMGFCFSHCIAAARRWTQPRVTSKGVPKYFRGRRFSFSSTHAAEK